MTRSQPRNLKRHLALHEVRLGESQDFESPDAAAVRVPAVLPKAEQLAAVSRHDLVDSIAEDETAIQHRYLGIAQAAVFAVQIAQTVRNTRHFQPPRQMYRTT